MPFENDQEFLMDVWNRHFAVWKSFLDSSVAYSTKVLPALCHRHDLQDQVQAKKDQKKKLQKKIQGLEKNHPPDEDNLANLRKQVEEIEAEVNAIAKEILPMQDVVDQLSPIITMEMVLDDFEDSILICFVLQCLADQQELSMKCLSDKAENDAKYKTEIISLIQDLSTIRLFVLHGGPRQDCWLEAYDLYQTLQANIQEEPENAFHEIHSKLALAIALEFASPITIFDTDIPVDPLERYQHYVQAHKARVLDPYFDEWSVWEYRHVVNSDASNQELTWGRQTLCNYRPDQASSSNEVWRYAVAVRSDVGYRTPKWESRPRTYQQLISGGGRCGPRAWYGRFICKAFGIPTWGVRQPGHAAMARRCYHHGWRIILGGSSWDKSHWQNVRGREFWRIARGRAVAATKGRLDEFCRQVLLWKCAAKIKQENNLRHQCQETRRDLPMTSLYNIQLYEWARRCKVPEDFHSSTSARPNFGLTDLERYQQRTDVAKADCQVQQSIQSSNSGKSMLVLPACAFETQKNCTAMKSWTSGGQVLLENKDSWLTFRIPNEIVSLRAENANQESSIHVNISFLVCNVHRKQMNLEVHVLGKQESQTISLPIPYTKGTWMETTHDVRFSCHPGDTMRLARDKTSPGGFGLALKQIIIILWTSPTSIADQASS